MKNGKRKGLKMLKFEGKFKVGDRIKAYDFHPACDNAGYIEGTITKVGMVPHAGYKAFTINIENDSDSYVGPRVGDEGYIPMEVAIMEWDGRIVAA